MPGDYDGDGTTDVGVFDPATSTWYYFGSTAGFRSSVFGFEGVLPVPLDYDQPNGPTIQLSLVRLPAAGPAAERVGSLFLNPGGPGGSGVDFALFFGPFAGLELGPAVRAGFEGVAERYAAGRELLASIDGPGDRPLIRAGSGVVLENSSVT